jgi:hypothetical protein
MSDWPGYHKVFVGRVRPGDITSPEISQWQCNRCFLCLPDEEAVQIHMRGAHDDPPEVSVNIDMFAPLPEGTAPQGPMTAADEDLVGVDGTVFHLWGASLGADSTDSAGISA